MNFQNTSSPLSHGHGQVNVVDVGPENTGQIPVDVRDLPVFLRHFFENLHVES